jgi:non-heme chloroperoxidase
VPTQRGHGDASRPAAGYAMTDFAADAIAFMDAVGLESAVLAGTSMGSTVATLAAAAHPERVDGLVLMGAASSWRTDVALAIADEINQLTDPVDPAFVREFQESTVSKPVPAELIDTAVAESLQLPARLWREVLAACLDADVAGALPAIAAPTLIVWGDQDEIAPRAEQDALLAGIAGSRLEVYEGGGHAMHWEEPARIAGDLAVFAAEVQRSRRA